MNYIELIIESSRQTKAEICKNYGIPRRTIDSWASGERECPDYVINLLAYSIFSKMIGGRVPIYRVYEMERAGEGDQFETYATESFIKAVTEARWTVKKNQETKDNAVVEIRLYEGDPNDEETDYGSYEEISYS